MSIVQEILKSISNYPGGYSLLYDIIYERKNIENKNGKQIIRNTLSRMKKQGLVINKNGIWKITDEGEILLKERKSAMVHFYPRKKQNKNNNIQKTMIVIFDIPEKKRLYRDWLRNELVDLGYELIQKSVWFGPPLPKEFIIYLNNKKILQYLKFFKATKADIID